MFSGKRRNSTASNSDEIVADKANESPTGPSASASGVESPPHSTVSTEFGSLRHLSMSAYYVNDKPFTESEKVELLVNVLQSIYPDLPQYLFSLISDGPSPPKWNDIALPRGRSLHTCQIAFEEMRRQYRPSFAVTGHYPSTSFVNIAPHPSTVLGRSVSESHPHLTATRVLQPRPPQRTTESPHPPVTNGESPVYTRVPVTDFPTEPSKKRGRPSKAEVEERTRRLAAEGKEYQPKKRPAKKLRPSLVTDALDLKDEEESATPLLQTPTARAPDPTDGSGGSKRRSRRQTHEESPIPVQGLIGEIQPGVEEIEAERNIVESPSDRLLASHRDRGSVGSSLSRRTQQESDTLEHGHTESDQPP